MNSILNAETSAGKVLSGTEKEHGINRSSVEQGNTSAGKIFNKPLQKWEKVALLRQAMNRHHGRNFNEWGCHVFASALNPYEGDGANPQHYTRFFRDLLLFLSKPKVSAKFKENVPDGLQMVKQLSDIFLELLSITDYEEYAVYHSLEIQHDNHKLDFKGYAEKYLAGTELEMVIAPEASQEDLQRKRIEALFEKERARDKVYFEEREARLFDSFTLKTDEQLIVALDKYYPNEEWPADKLTIARQRTMIEHLNELEAKQNEEESETPEQKQERVIRHSVFHAMKRREYDFTINNKKPAKAPAAAKKTSTKKKA